MEEEYNCYTNDKQAKTHAAEMREAEVKAFVETFEDHIFSYLDDDNSDEHETVQEIFNSELNFNNADPTTHMHCRSEEEISSLLDDCPTYVGKNYDGRCAECGKSIPDDAYSGEYESRGEHFGAPCSEYVTTGFECPRCGHSESM